MALLNRMPVFLKWLLGLLGLLLVLMTAYRFFFFLTYSGTQPFSGSVFFLGLRFDLRVIAFTGIILAILGLIPGFNPFRNNKAFRWWQVLLAVIFFIVVIFYSADFYHYDYLQQRLNASVLNFLEDAAISFGMMWESYPVILIGIILIAAVVLFLFASRKLFGRFKYTAITVKSSAAWYTSFFVILGILAFGQVGQYPLRWSDAFRYGDNFKASLALNPFQSFFSTLKFRRTTFDKDRVRENYPLMADYFGIDSPSLANLNFSRAYKNYSDTSIRPNVVLVICESFSASKSSMFGNALDPTPYFANLCKEGIFFERCFTPSFGTARGVWATITGIPDVESPKTASRNPLAVDQHSIINDFKGYDRYYFLGGSTTWANIRGLLTNNISGLKIYEQDDFEAAQEDVWGISDKNLFLEAIKRMSESKRPFFSIIQTANNHRPYTIPSEDIGEFKVIKVPQDTLDKYNFQSNEELNAFRYMDFCIEKFMKEARKQQWFENTVFIFVGDHGLRGSAGNYFPESFSRQGIGAQHVPLLFYSSLLKPARVTRVASQLDILPTAAVMAKQSHTNTTMGVNLLDSLMKQRFAFIADPDLHTIGLVSDEHYYRRNLRTGLEEFVPVTTDSKVPAPDSLHRYMKRMTDAWYESAKYLLLNNKKNQ